MTVDYLVSSYNKGAYLPAVLQSVSDDRELTGGRIILIDDGSQDGSDAICAAFSRRNGHTLYKGQKNRGLFATVNSLAEQVQGSWVRWVDCDDPILPGSTDFLIALAGRTGTALAFGAADPYGPSPLPLADIAPFNGCGARDHVIADALDYSLRGFEFVPAQSVLRAESLKETLPLREDLISCADYAVNLRVARTTGFAVTSAAVCRRLTGVQQQLSAREALTFHQTLRIVQDVAREGFDANTKRKAVAKQISRAMRWMRRNRRNARFGTCYWNFFLRRQFCRLPGLNVPFERWSDAVADVYAADVADVLGGVRPY